MAQVRIESGGSSGELFEISTDQTTVGRSPDCNITLSHPSISGTHCCITRDGNRYSIKDAGSTNGISVNRDKVTESKLQPKDVIMVGSVKMIFDGDDVEFDAGDLRQHTQRPVVQTGTHVDKIETPSAFHSHNETKATWMIALAVVALAGIALAVVFGVKRFGG